MSRVDTPWTLTRQDFDLASVLAAARRQRIAVIVPARNEAATIGAVVDAATAHPGLVDELVVVNDHSSDDTHSVASHHGARVVDLDAATGMGAALAAGVAASSAPLLVFLDGDVLNPDPDHVARMIQPLLERDEVRLVKGYYERPLHDMPAGGGRVNELAARPILSLLYPGLGEIRQPLAGETAMRRDTVTGLPFEDAYGVEIALLIDVARRDGVGSLAQVDLGVRRHRNRPLDELRPMAAEVLRAALTRYGVRLPPS